ncbi:hypothetical protein O9992_00790 [Vibrio lentus]|nr:hypothetical protein [Vibrio lentus]
MTAMSYEFPQDNRCSLSVDRGANKEANYDAKEDLEEITTVMR